MFTPKVRANRLAVLNEVLADYPTDGVELNMADYAPYVPGPEHAEALTGWLREIRACADAAAAAQGRAKRVVVRAEP
jgi:hypothetical protein